MSINENYYGSQNSGIDGYNQTYYSHNIVCKIPNWRTTVANVINGSYLAKIADNPDLITKSIDTSIAHCGIGKKGDFLEWTYEDGGGNTQTEILTAKYDHYMRNMHWISLKRDISISTIQGETVTVSFGIDADDNYNSSYSDIDIPVWFTLFSNKSNINNAQRIFSAIAYTDNETDLYFHWGNDKQKYKIPQTLGYNSPIIKYGLGDFVFVIFVECSSTATGSNSQTVELANYIDTTSTYNYTNRPFVGRVYAVPYTWTSGGAASRTLGFVQGIAPSFNRKFSITAPFYSRATPTATGTKDFYFYDMQQTFYSSGFFNFCKYNIFCTSNTINGTDWTTENQAYPTGIYDTNTPVQTIHFYYVAGFDFWKNCGFGELRPVGSSGSYTMQTCILHLQSQSDCDKLKEYAFEMCAYLGVFFSDRIVSGVTIDTTLTIEEQWKQAFTDDNIYCGIIDENGLTHGFYTHGQGNTATLSYGNDNAQNATPYKPTPFNPDTPPTPTDENDKGDLNTHLNSGYYATPAKYYATTETQITKLIDFINTYAPTDAELTADFKGVNPSDYITNVLFYPFNVMYSGAASQIYLSVLNTMAIGLKFNPSFGVTVADFGGISIDRYFNDFRDYPPYTKLTLNIPFAECINLDIGEYYGHTLNIKSVIDYTTGDMLTLIMRDGLVTKTVSCNCAIQLPFSALAMATYQQSLNTLQSNSKINETRLYVGGITDTANTSVSVATAIMTGGASMAISNPITVGAKAVEDQVTLGEQVKQTDYALQHTTPSPVQISGGTPCNLAMLEYIPRYTITRCKSLNIIDYNIYGQTVGFATAQQGRVSNFSGFIVCSDVEFDTISATAAEQEMIKNLLKGGVVV